MTLSVVGALVRRQLYLYQRTPMRLVELMFWPLVDLIIWGNVTVFIQRNSSADFGAYVLFLIGAMILWDVLFRAQQGVSISFLEDVWTRNLLNIFVAPVRTIEYLAATYAIGGLRIIATFLVMSVVSHIGYGFNVLALDWWLVPFFLNLMLFGWALGMVSTALFLRWGQAVESLAWAVPFFIQPFAAVFYRVEDMPSWMQPLAWCIPATPVFEGMRQVLQTGQASASLLALAFALNALYLLMAGLLFARVLHVVRTRGLLTKFATQ